MRHVSPGGPGGSGGLIPRGTLSTALWQMFVSKDTTHLLIYSELVVQEPTKEVHF
jgi:hypothetical protein